MFSAKYLTIMVETAGHHRVASNTHANCDDYLSRRLKKRIW